MLASRLLIGISLAALAAGTASAQSNSTTYNQTGTGNQAEVDNTIEGNVGNSAVITQNGVNNSATVFQRGQFNRVFIEQIGVGNRSIHQQSGNNNNSENRQNGDFNAAIASQVGTLNNSNVAQTGFYNTSTVRQGFALDPSLPPTGEFRPTQFNTATVDQNGAGLRSIISQRAASTSAPAANSNVANVVQRSSGVGDQLQQYSEITQESASNFAQVSQQQGGVSAPNSSTIVQRNLIAPGVASLNSTSVSQSGQNLSSQVTQNGVRNNATVQMVGGGAAAAEAVSGQISQSGSDLNAITRFGRGRSGTGSSTTVTQTGAGHSVETYHFGTSDRSSITQVNGLNVSSQERARAFVSQNATNASSTINQTGDNYGEVVQALGSDITTRLTQVDAGNLGDVRASNSSIVSQYGNLNSTIVDQNSLNATALVWQRVGSSNNETVIGQGSGGTASPSTTGTAGFAAGPTGAGTGSLFSDVTQAGSYNSLTNYQDGNSLSARIEQNGNGTAPLRNTVFISQTGTGNSATAYQGPGVGPSASTDPASGNSAAQNGGAQDEFFFGGGSRSAEIRILQTSNNNTATVSQYGAGQYGRIEQSGSGNIASITQEALAANSTAVIRQTGNGNTYYVVQTAPGQYISVLQAGDANVATNVVKRGDMGGHNGFTPPGN